MELTSKKYWQDFYEAASENRETIIKVCSRYDQFWEIMVKSCRQPPSSILEIGAFPGRYLAYLSAKYRLHATGIDFNPDQEKFERSMLAMRVSDFTYVCEDFLKHMPSQQYDLVISNGFVEHFTNYDEVLDKHTHYLKTGGVMLVMIPNKRYLRKLYGYFLDRENLKAHNLNSMRLEVFRNFSKRNDLTIHYMSYYGGFAFKVHQPLSFIQRTIYRLVRFASIKLDGYLNRHPSKWYSGSIIAIFSKD